MGENLARVLTSTYGGHVLTALKTVSQLASTPKQFVLFDYMSYNVIEGVHSCVFEDGHTLLLEKMTRRGCALITRKGSEKPIVESIVANRVDGVVYRNNSTVTVLEWQILFWRATLILPWSPRMEVLAW